MKRHGLLCVILMLPLGCSQHHRYEVDLTTLRGFDWNGKLVVADRNYGLFEGWKTEQIELESRDGSTFIVVPRGGDLEFIRVSDQGRGAKERIEISETGAWFTRQKQTRPVVPRMRAAPPTTTQTAK